MWLNGSPPPAPVTVALALGVKTYPRLGLRRGVERFVREENPSWRLIQKVNHTHLDWPEVMQGNPDGLIGFFEDAAHFQWVGHSGVPAVNLNRVPGFGGVTEVLVDDPEVGRLAARHLLEKGFENFVFCTHVPHKGFSEDRRAGFEEELRRHGRSCGLLAIEWHDPPSCDALARWRGRPKTKRTAAFCCDDACAGLMIALCRRTGIDVPGDLAILGAGDDPFHSENDSITLSTVKVDFIEVGYQAAAMLDRLLTGVPEQKTLLRVPPTGVNERSSTAQQTEPTALRRLLRLVDERHTDPDFNPVMAAALCKVSSRTLRRYLKDAGKPPLSDLLRDRRLDAAMAQLLTTQEPVERIAESCGFLDYTTFFRAFRRRHGTNPTDFRRKVEATA